MFFLSRELQSQSINCTDFQYEVERTRESVSVIDDDQIQAKVNEYCDKIGVPLELTLTMPIHQTRSTSSNSAANSINNQIFNLKSYMKGMIEEEFRIQSDSKNIQWMKAFNGLDASMLLGYRYFGLSCRACILTAWTLTDPSSNWNCRGPKSIFGSRYRLAKRDVLT